MTRVQRGSEPAIMKQNPHYLLAVNQSQLSSLMRLRDGLKSHRGKEKKKDKKKKKQMRRFSLIDPFLPVSFIQSISCAS